MRLEVGADQAAVERPVVLGIGGGVDSCESAAATDVALERGLLRGVEDVAGRAQEHHRRVVPEGGIGERRRVLRRIDPEPVPGAERADGLDSWRDRRVAEAGRLGEHEDALRCRAGTRFGRGEQERAADAHQGRHENGCERA